MRDIPRDRMPAGLVEEAAAVFDHIFEASAAGYLNELPPDWRAEFMELWGVDAAHPEEVYVVTRGYEEVPSAYPTDRSDHFRILYRFTSDVGEEVGGDPLSVMGTVARDPDHDPDTRASYWLLAGEGDVADERVAAFESPAAYFGNQGIIRRYLPGGDDDGAESLYDSLRGIAAVHTDHVDITFRERVPDDLEPGFRDRPRAHVNLNLQYDRDDLRSFYRQLF